MLRSCPLFGPSPRNRSLGGLKEGESRRRHHRGRRCDALKKAQGADAPPDPSNAAERSAEPTPRSPLSRPASPEEGFWAPSWASFCAAGSSVGGGFSSSAPSSSLARFTTSVTPASAAVTLGGAAVCSVAPH